VLAIARLNGGSALHRLKNSPLLLGGILLPVAPQRRRNNGFTDTSVNAGNE
jgi:hypothetical protein